MSFSLDRKMIASASEDNTTRLWNTGGRELFALKGKGIEALNVSFSPDGKTLTFVNSNGTIS